MMKRTHTIMAAGAIALAATAMGACRGRHADATPNGETVDVVLENRVDIPACADTLPEATAPDTIPASQLI